MTSTLVPNVSAGAASIMKHNNPPITVVKVTRMFNEMPNIQ
jgi:hypothetical protein